MLRKLYYLLPPSYRLLARRIAYFPLDLWQKPQNNLIPPKGMIYTGSGDFLKDGLYWLDIFKKYGALQKNSNVLDIGSGIGRVAVGLTNYLSSEAHYEGFDVVETGVNWCKTKISTQFPNFQFTYADLFNDLYRSNGSDAANYQFPYPENYFDIACSISVFTHILPKETDNYLKETHKSLKKGGFLIATFFLLDDESKVLMQNHNGFKFPYQFDDYALMDKSVTSANVAYRRDFIYKISKAHGFDIVKIIDGHWCGRSKTTDSCFQDMLIFQKRE